METIQTAGEIVGKAIKGIGIDVSKWQGQVDWATASKHTDFVIIRATNGLKSVDPFFLLNAEGAISQNLPFGAYHFASFTAPTRQQADRFLSIVQKASQKPSMPLVLDVETNDKTIPISPTQLEDLCLEFTTYISQSGYEPMIYMSPGFSWFFPKSHKLGNIKLWIADYTAPIGKINGWPTPFMHQYTDKGQIPGIKTTVDLNKVL